jgi:hypothetical protein
MSGYVDKTERVPRPFIVERKRASRRAGASALRGRPAGPTEEQIHRTVVQWLDRRRTAGVHFFHPANGGFRNKGEAARLKAMGVQAGEPDIVLIFRGRIYGLELKAAGGVQSPDQEHIERQWEEAGATYAVARGLDYALDTLRDWGLLQ